MTKVLSDSTETLGLKPTSGVSRRSVAEVTDWWRAGTVNLANRRTWLAEPIEYVSSAQFERADADATILGADTESEGAAPAEADVDVPPQAPRGTPPYLASLYQFPLLSRRQEFLLFRKMNYLKFCAERLRQGIDPDDPQMDVLDQIKRRLDESLEIRNQIVRANLRLVVSIAKTVVGKANNFEDAVSDGNLPLIRAVEIFDFERGTKFSTYATWAVRNSLYRVTSRNHRHHNRYVTAADRVFENAQEYRPSQQARENYYCSLRTAIDNMLSELDSRDRKIVFDRYGLDGNGKPQRFREIAERLNISTERVRQLLARSITRMGQSIEAGGVSVESRNSQLSTLNLFQRDGFAARD